MKIPLVGTTKLNGSPAELHAVGDPEHGYTTAEAGSAKSTMTVKDIIVLASSAASRGTVVLMGRSESREVVPFVVELEVAVPRLIPALR